MAVVRTPAKPPTLCLRFALKTHPDRPADRYKTALDGKARPYRAVQTVAGGLRVGVGDDFIDIMIHEDDRAINNCRMETPYIH